MKKYIYILLIVLGFSSCTDLDRYPLDEGSSETWYSSTSEYELALNDLYRYTWWEVPKEMWNDDIIYRKLTSAIVNGTLNSGTDSDFGDSYVPMYTIYYYKYKAITRANLIINNYQRGLENGIEKSLLDSYVAQARFARANFYGSLVFYFGDVVYLDDEISIEESYTKPRTPKEEVIQHIYDDFDYAIANLPVSHSGKQTATKGAALALKARWALYFGDYDIAAEAAKQCLDLGVYRLHEDYGDYFHARNDKESIFLIPASANLKLNVFGDCRNFIPRLAGGYAGKMPSWALFATYECTDGLTIDKSPLFDKTNPFKNRDPRCTATIVEFGTEVLGFEFNPRPSVTTVTNYKTNTKVKNIDNYPIGNANASFSGLAWRKKVEETWNTNTTADNDNVIIRLADVYLIYAEAMIEQNKIDQTVLDAINKVRARAYKCDYTDTSKYPAITTTNQTELRKILRRERRVEFPFEGIRYFDIIRWRIAKKALNMPNCGMVADKTKAKSLEKTSWFWSDVPTFDEDGIPNFQALIDAGTCDVHSTGAFEDREYLWPIPSKEMQINPNLTQNPGY
jgi:hypothetical protein